MEMLLKLAEQHGIVVLAIIIIFFIILKSEFVVRFKGFLLKYPRKDKE